MKIVLLPYISPRLYFAKASPKLTEKPYTGTQGLYSAVVPDGPSAKYIQALAKYLGFDIDPAKIHCTVMYSPEKCPKTVECDPSRIFRVYTHRIQYWDGHDAKGYISLGLISPELVDEHKRLLKLGCEATFSPYSPHVTLYSGMTMTPELEGKMAKLNRGMKSWGELRFINQFIGDMDD